MLAPASSSVWPPTFCRLTSSSPARARNDGFPDGCEVDEQRGAAPVRSRSRFGRVASYSGGSLLSFLPFSFTCLYFDLWLLDTNIDVIVMATVARPPRARTRRINCICIYLYIYFHTWHVAGPNIIRTQRGGLTYFQEVVKETTQHRYFRRGFASVKLAL